MHGVFPTILLHRTGGGARPPSPFRPDENADIDAGLCTGGPTVRKTRPVCGRPPSDVRLPGNPVRYVVNALLLSSGSWILWGGVFYFFMNENVKSLFSRLIWAVCGVSIIDYMFF